MNYEKNKKYIYVVYLIPNKITKQVTNWILLGKDTTSSLLLLIIKRDLKCLSSLPSKSIYLICSLCESLVNHRTINLCFVQIMAIKPLKRIHASAALSTSLHWQQHSIQFTGLNKRVRAKREMMKLLVKQRLPPEIVQFNHISTIQEFRFPLICFSTFPSHPSRLSVCRKSFIPNSNNPSFFVLLRKSALPPHQFRCYDLINIKFQTLCPSFPVPCHTVLIELLQSECKV